VFFQFAQYTKLKNEQRLRVQHIAERLAYTAAQPMWSFDRDYIEQLLLQEFKESEVLTLFLTSADGTFSIGKTRQANGVISVSNQQHAELISADQLSASAHITYKNQNIGSVKVILNMATSQHKIWNIMIMNSVQMLLLLGFIASLTYVGLSRLVLRPLKLVHAFALELAAGNLSARMETQTSDEIGNLTVTLNMMAEKTDKAQAFIREKEEQLRLYLQRLPIACILWGTDYRVQSWNPAAERIFGYTEAEALGKTANELIVPEPTRAHVDGVWEKITDGKLETASVNENITREGRTILCEWTNTPYFDKDGNVTGIISVAQDISGRKQAETVMIQSEKMTMIAGMAAGMAHEVNNPLGIIAQDLQNLERRFSPTLPANGKIADELGLNLDLVEQYMERRDITIYIANMRKAVKRASNIISNMLQFSRQSDASHQLFNFNDVIEQSIKLASNDYDLRKKYDFKNVSISREYSENMPMVSLCITEIEQVIINLLKNAAQAMFDAETSSPSIHIRTFFENGYVVVTFNDNGPGMTEEVKKRIFDPFFTTKEVGLGTGLGLSVSYTIVTKNHGGELSVETQLGRGACFTVGIPVAAF
jgi:PAS domain S-box-containing protein